MLAALGACSAIAPRPAERLERVTLSLVVPNPCWRVEIRTVRRRGDELLVVSELVPPPPELACAEQLARAEQTLGVRVAPPRRVRHLVLGRTFARADPGTDVTFVDSPAELERLLEGSQPLAGFEQAAPR